MLIPLPINHYMTEMIRIAPYQYIHLFDTIYNVTRIEVGPSIYTPKDNEKLILKPTNMVKLPPKTYCIIENPVILDKQKRITEVVYDIKKSETPKAIPIPSHYTLVKLWSLLLLSTNLWSSTH